MPKTRKNHNSRKRTGGVHPHPAGTWYDNKGQPQKPYPNNRLFARARAPAAAHAEARRARQAMNASDNRDGTPSPVARARALEAHLRQPPHLRRSPPPPPPRLRRTSGHYDRSEQPDLSSSSDGSSISSHGSSEGSYASSLTSDEGVYDGMSQSLRNWYEIMGDAAAPPRRRSGTPRRLNLGSGALKRKSRKNRKSKKSKKSRKSRKNKRVVRKTRRQSRKHRR